MEHLGDRFVRKEPRERREVIDEDGVDCRGLIRGCGLDEAQPRKVGPLSEELGVDGQNSGGRGTLAERGQSLVVRNVHRLSIRPGNENG